MGNLNFIVYFEVLVIFSFAFADGSGLIGVNYGRVADDLPQPANVVELLKTQGVNRVKIYDSDESVLTAFSGSGIKIVAGVTNELLSSIAQDQSVANQWVENNIIAYYPSTQIISIAVGSEVFDDSNNITMYLVSAMQNVYTALTKYNLQSNISVSTPIALSVLQSSFPPSAGSFKTELIEPVLKPMLDFLNQTGSYLMMNVYPFFAYSANADVISLDYALFRENPGVVDSGNGLSYASLFDAQIDAVFAAMLALNYNDLKLVVTESGWPSIGDETGAGEQNAAAYNGNLVKRVLTGGGTPLKPNETLDVYLFALFNENMKPGPTSERNFGLFYPNEQMVYNISLNSEGDGTSSSNQTWCVANGNVDATKLQEALDYACGQGGADCSPIQPGATCYDPNTLEAHASYAFNSYYQKNTRATGTCDFGGTAYVVSQSPRDGTSSSNQTWCVANGNVDATKLQEALDYACGQGGADCSPIQPGATCYDPNTLEAHASYAFNSYYQKNNRATGTCDFGGTAYVVSQSPKYGNCVYPTGP